MFVYVPELLRLEYIGVSAFQGNDIQKLDLNYCKKLKNIDRRAFYINYLSSIYLPENITNIGPAAFNANKISEINGTASDGLIYGRNTDGSIDFTTIVSYGGSNKFNINFIPSTVTTIGNYAFADNYIREIDLSNCTSLTTIGNGAFMSNYMTYINLSYCTNLESIGDFAFRWNKITSIDIRNCNKLKAIGSMAFNGNEISEINGAPSNGIIFGRNPDGSEDNTTIVSYGGTNENLNFIPSSVTTIADYAFFNNKYIKTIDFSNCPNLKSIGSESFKSGWYISTVNFSNCTNLENIGEKAFYGNKITNLDLSNCTSLENIGKEAFCLNKIPNIDLSSCTKLLQIGERAFDSNLLNAFLLPTPNIEGYKLNYWYDSRNNRYKGGEKADNVWSSYTALLTKTYHVTFSITDGINPIAGTIITLNGYGQAITDEAGIASFQQIPNMDNLEYTASKTGYSSVSDKLTINGNDVTKNVILNLFTYISEADHANIEIYPNPATNKITVNGAMNQTISMYNLAGVKVWLFIAKSDKEDFMLHNLPTGLYLVKIVTKTSRLVVK